MPDLLIPNFALQGKLSMKYKLAIYILSMALFGCATELQRKDMEADAWTSTLPDANADYGSYPSDYQEIIKKYLTRNLKDPESARYSEYTKPRKEHAVENVNKKQAIYGYSVCVLINAKNSYGGYTGNHQYWFLIKNSQVIRSKDTNTDMFGEYIYRGHPINCQAE